ncbi:MAG: tetrahydrodipicolinate N-succinyltransferase N-terminal domain-containing protein [Myxococcales bacterium]|nr:tetrahydrodipicolinate N-succinyltransferase N-terminal domain-containing protein [Myxococcales bacterium]MCB9641712.1 tetrahydrodipicolinate N-succinyltransferase N-terminal domain-containing protein [Myxococcales bacterium]
MDIKTIEDFQTYVQTIEADETYQRPLAYGLGVRRSKYGKTLDVFFPQINYQTNFGGAAICTKEAGKSGAQNGFAVMSQTQLKALYEKFLPYKDDKTKPHPNLRTLEAILEAYQAPQGYADIDVIVYFLYDADQAVETPEEAYFKLQCLSQRCVKPHGINVQGVFGALNNVAWTNYGPIFPEDIATQRIKYLFTNQPLQVSHVDKFPYLVDYHLPSGCRITSNSQVRLGAYLGEGTTVMPAGYINFNAGTEGHAMVEGRISGGVFVGNHSDIGGGASIMGTLSGGNKNVISLGEKCLLGANAGTGISLGFGCTIQAGLYITAGMKVSLYNQKDQPVDLNGEIVEEGQNIVKAMELNGRDKMLFIQDSRDGRVICKPNPKTIELNPALHKN